nr:MAG TPA: minor tail protein [Caudoviricetes sp.]
MVSSQFGESNRMNRFATDNNDIISGLSRSSAAMAAMNSTLSETIALFTAGQEVLQDSEKMGNALKSVAMRVRGYDESTEELSDDLVDITGKVIDLTKVASNDYKGVSLFTDETQEHYKSIYDYLVQIADVYDELSEKNQQELLEKLFGKYQAQAGAAILSNIQAAKDVMNVIENESAGSADREMEVIKDSVDYAKNQLTETLTGIAQSSITRDFEKTILQSLTRVLDVLGDASSPLNGVLTTVSSIFDVVSKLIEKIGLIPTILAGISAKKLFQNIGTFSIKNWVSDLKQATTAAESFKTITTSFKGTGINAIIDDTTIAKYATSINGLTLEQAKLALSTTQLSASEKELILTKAGLITSSEALTAQETISLVQQELGNKADAKSILLSAGLVTEKQLEENATISLTAAQIQEATSKGILSVKDAELIVSALGVQGANYGEAVSFQVLTKAIGGTIKAIGKFLISNPVGWLILLAGAIATTVAITDALTVSFEESKEELDNIKSECKKTEDELKSLNDELQTTAEKINELKGKDSLTFTEKEEYDNLVNTNNELQRKIDLLELEQKIENQKKNKTFVQTMVKDTENPFEHEVNPDGKKPVSQYSISDEYLTNETGYIKAQFEIRKKLLDDLSNSETDEERERIQKRLDDIEEYLTSKNDEWSEIANDISYIREPTTEDDKAVNEWLDYINDFQDKYAIALGGTNAKTNAFNRVVDNWQFDDAVQDLQDLGKQGKVTAKMLDDPKYDEFIDKLVEIGVVDSADNLDLIALAFNGMSGALDGTIEPTNNSVTAVTSLNDALTKLQELLKDIISGSSTYQSAMQKITTGTGLTAKEVNELLELDPSLFDKFVKQKNGTWTIDLEALRLSYDTIIVDGGKDAIADQVAEYQNEFDSQTARLQELQKEYDELANYTPQGAESPSASSERKYRLEQLQSEIDETKKFIDDAQRDIDLASFQESLLDYSDADRIRDSFDDITKQIDNYNDGITKINKAIENVIGTTVTGSQELDEFNAEMQKNYGLGNVDLTTRPKVELDDGSTATVLSGLEYLWQGNEEDGQYVGVHITPILPNGEVLSDEELSNYIQNILADADNILEADKVENGGKGLVLKVDTDLNLSEVDIASLNSGGELTEHMQEVLTVADEWDNKLHEVQEQWMNLDNTVNKVSGTAILSYDDMTELIELYPELAGKFKETSNGFEIEVQALEKISKQAYQTRDDFIDSEIAMSKVAIEETKVRLLALKAEIEGIASQDEYLVAIEKGTFEKYNNALAEIESLNNYINILESYKSPIKSPENNDKDISNSLQNQIDYYTTLLDAIEAVTDKQIDALEKEKDAIDSKIDALNDEKDALKDKNDEQQRELDLIEAQNNLDKAKKQKVFVYKEGEGLVQVQDEKAVKDAQKELDDVNADIEEAKIDKQIDALKKDQDEIDNQIDALNDYKDSFSDMESNAKDQLAIEQAKKALGVDENGLLHIDETTAKNIRDGLAEAIYNKDVNDNKNNGKYVTVSLADYLSGLGATVTPQQFQAIANTATGNTPITAPVTNSTVNNAQSIVNNKSITLNNTFNVYDSKDSNTVIEQIKSYMNKTLRTAINSIK